MKTEFKPNYAIHPGVILKEELEFISLSQLKLSEKTGISKTIINDIIKGKRDINAQYAVLFENVFEHPAKFWLRLQSLYDETMARLQIGEKNKNIFIFDTDKFVEIFGTSYTGAFEGNQLQVFAA
jgi:addiction module HigA family antidote